MRIQITALIALAGLALVSGSDADAKAGDFAKHGYVHFLPDDPTTMPTGWYLSDVEDPSYAPNFGLLFLSHSDRSIDFKKFKGKFCHVFGEFHEGSIFSAPNHLYDSVNVAHIEVSEFAKFIPAIQNELVERNIDFRADGTAVPNGGLDAQGVCADGWPAMRMPLLIENGADMYAFWAYACEDCDCYWINRSGGFAGESHWVGPFGMPGAVYTPQSVRPHRVRVPVQPRRKKLVIRRERGAIPAARSETFAPDDFDFGPGITVLEVLRSKRRKVKVLVEIAPDAPLGTRDVTLRGETGTAVFETRPRRKR